MCLGFLCCHGDDIFEDLNTMQMRPALQTSYFQHLLLFSGIIDLLFDAKNGLRSVSFKYINTQVIFLLGSYSVSSVR